MNNEGNMKGKLGKSGRDRNFSIKAKDVLLEGAITSKGTYDYELREMNAWERRELLFEEKSLKRYLGMSNPKWVD